MRVAVRILIVAAIAAGFSWLFVREVDVAAAWSGVRGLPLWSIVAALALILGSFVVMAVRWHFLLRSAGVRLSPVFLLPTVYLGSGLNNVVPARGGDVLRIESTRQRARIPGFLVAGTLAVERLLDGVVLALLIVVGALLAGETGRFLLVGIVLSVGVALGVAVAVAAVARPELVRRPAGRIVRALPARWQEGAARAGDNFLRGFAVVASPWPFAAALLASAAMWLAQAAAYAVLGEGLALGIGAGAYLLLKGIGQLAFAFPATVAGLGVFDYVVLESGRGLGLTPEDAGAFTLAAHAFDVVPITALGILFLWRAFPQLESHAPGRLLETLRLRSAHLPRAPEGAPERSAPEHEGGQTEPRGGEQGRSRPRSRP